ncbi:hypothetical protein [Pontibacter ruber]|uniref:Uncharacterized protein n=1 Tax=Pontibacter ruber TaxID=1343895 RepID=A0ABW5CSF3_9BACT|nr:hypothetical protein [Pontibacter ruber]
MQNGITQRAILVTYDRYFQAEAATLACADVAMALNREAQHKLGLHLRIMGMSATLNMPQP